MLLLTEAAFAKSLEVTLTKNEQLAEFRPLDEAQNRFIAAV